MHIYTFPQCNTLRVSYVTTASPLPTTNTSGDFEAHSAPSDGIFSSTSSSSSDSAYVVDDETGDSI